MCACVVFGHQQLHRVTTLPVTHSNMPSSSSSSVPDWVQRSVKFGNDKTSVSSSRLSVSGVSASDLHVPLSPQSSDASSGSAGADIDDASCSTGMQGICYTMLSLHL